jgi:parvulin-like peptidyl-prolyl isomerase
MIITIRKAIKEHAAQWLGAVVLAVLAFGLFYTPSMRRSIDPRAWVMEIDKEKIGMPEFRQRVVNVQRHMAMLRAQYGQLADLIVQAQGLSSKPEEHAQQSIMHETLLNQAAERIGIRLNPSYTRENMARVQQELFEVIPVELSDPYRGLNLKYLHQWLLQQGLSEEYLEQLIAHALARQLLQDLSAQAAYVPDYLLEHEAVIQTASRTFSVLSFSLEAIIKQEEKKPVSEAELSAFYNQENARNQRYWIPEKRSATVWRFEPTAYGITVSQDDINSYYEDHKSQRYVQEPAKVQVRHILLAVPSEADRQTLFEKAQSIQAKAAADPAQFAALAKEFSADTVSAKEGGLVPFFARGEKEKTFEKAAFTLKADGDISSVISTDKGFEIIQRVAKKTPVFKPLNQVKTDIEKLLLDQKFDEAFSAAARDIVDQYAQNPEALETFVREKKGTKTTVKDIDRSNETWGKHLFKMSAGELSFSLEKDAGLIIQLGDITERHLPVLSQIQSKVTQDLYQDRAAKALTKQVDAAKKEAKTHPLDQVQKQLGGTLETISGIKPDDKKQVEALEHKGLPAQQMFQIEKNGGILEHFTKTHGYLIRLDTLEPLPEEQRAQAITTKKDAIEGEYRALFVRGFIASLARHATIKVNEIEKEETEEQDVASEE